MSTVVELEFSGGGLTDDDISANASIDAGKVGQQFAIDRQLFAEGAAITALASELLHIVHGETGVIAGFEAIITTVATGADRTANIDLQKSTGGGAFATILTGTILFNDSSTARTVVPAVLSNAAVVDGDILRAVVAVAGSADAQAAGLAVTLSLEEETA